MELKFVTTIVAPKKDKEEHEKLLTFLNKHGYHFEKKTSKGIIGGEKETVEVFIKR